MPKLNLKTKEVTFDDKKINFRFANYFFEKIMIDLDTVKDVAYLNADEVLYVCARLEKSLEEDYSDDKRLDAKIFQKVTTALDALDYDKQALTKKFLNNELKTKPSKTTANSAVLN